MKFCPSGISHSVEWWLFTNDSGQTIGPIFKGQAVFLDFLDLDDGQIGFLKMTTKLYCITSQKSKDLTYTKAKVRNPTFMAIFPSQSTSYTRHSRSKVTLLLTAACLSFSTNKHSLDWSHIYYTVSQSINQSSQSCVPLHTDHYIHSPCMQQLMFGPKQTLAWCHIAYTNGESPVHKKVRGESCKSPHGCGSIILTPVT